VHTLARNESDYDSNTHISEVSEITFCEGNFIDYKYFDQQNKTPAYEFGFSYTTFTYRASLTITPNAQALEHTYATGARAVSSRKDLWGLVSRVSTTVRNTGDVAGAENAQLYVESPAEEDEPVRQLRGFGKMVLQPGQTKQLVQFELRRRIVWDTEDQG